MESGKREDYLSWQDYFISLAHVSSLRSKDPSTQVGACIVDKKNRIVSLGYNGFPMGCSDEEFPWTKNSDDPLENKYAYVVHAEANAILNSNSDVKGCTLYVTMFPCNECAKLIIQSGIEKVIYTNDKYHDDWKFVAARKMFDAAHVTYEFYSPVRDRIIIDLRL